MRNLICWCPQTHQPIDLQLYTDYATLARIWSSSGRYGYRKVAGLLRQAGWIINDKRVERIWQHSQQLITAIFAHRPQEAEVDFA